MMTSDPTIFWRLPGVWIASLGLLFMFANAYRSWRAPVAFATYLGLPLSDARDDGFVRIYALRALFIGLAIIALLALRDARALGYFALAAAVMPVGDAWLTRRAGAPTRTVVRHVVIAVVLVIAAALLCRL